MKPLLSIQTVPIAIEYKTTSAKIERSSDRSEMEITRKKGGFSMKSNPIKINIDTFEARNSIVPTAMRSISQSAEDGIKTVRNTMARFAEEGQLLVNNTKGPQIFDQIFEARVDENKQFTLDFVPKYPAMITWTPPELNMEYELDKLTFNWKTNKGEFQFVPASVDFNITEYPRVIITYTGDPMYVPPSADPNYIPVNAKA